MARLNDLDGLEEGGDSRAEAERYLEALDLVRSESQFEFADDTLRGIYDYIKERMYVTQGQKKAVENILRTKGKTLEDYY